MNNSPLPRPAALAPIDAANDRGGFGLGQHGLGNEGTHLRGYAGSNPDFEAGSMLFYVHMGGWENHPKMLKMVISLINEDVK